MRTNNKKNKNEFYFPNLLNSKDKNNLINKLENYYGVKLEYLNEYNFYINKKNKVYLSKINLLTELNKLNIKKIISIGIYFGTFHSENRFRLSIEGSKFIKARKNFIRINKKTLKSYLAAENLFKEEIDEINYSDNCPFLIVIFENENIGSVSIKENIILNYIPKSRKLDFNKLF